MRQITTRVNAMTASIALRPADEIRSETTTVAGSTFSSGIIQFISGNPPLLLPTVTRVVKVQKFYKYQYSRQPMRRSAQVISLGRGNECQQRPQVKSAAA
jgi:hypothetical protein